MSVYLANYWSLYSEFVNILKDVKYREIPIALMTNFYQHIDSDLKNEMERKEFAINLNYATINELRQIQPFFENQLSPLKKPLKTQLDGKVLINSDFTRIPIKVLHENFSVEHTMIFSRSRSSEYNGFPNEFNGNSKRNTNEISKKLISRVNFILSKYENHPAFSNSYFKKIFIQRIPIIVETLERIFNLFDEKPIATVLIGTMEDIGSRSLAIVASMKGIPCICLQHGLLIGEEAFIPVFSSHVAVYGEYEKRWYLARGLEEGRISVIGHPRFDEIFTSSRIPKNTLFNEYKLDTNKITLLIITGPYLEPLKFKKMISELAENKKFQILIKPHPWELGKKKIRLYTEIADKFNSVQVITNRTVHTHDLIFHSDAVVATLSTAALESCLFNKPVFVYYFMQSNRYYDYFDRLGKFIRNEAEGLVKMISLYFNDAKEKTDYMGVSEKFLQDSYGSNNAGKDLTNLIYQLSGVRPK